MGNITPAFDFKAVTSLGEYYASVEADTPGQAERRLRQAIEEAAKGASKPIEITSIVRLKTFPANENSLTITGTSVLAAKAFWYALGRGKEYEQQLEAHQAQRWK